MAALRLFWNVASLNCRSRTDFTSPFTFIQNWLNFVKESSQTELRSRQANFHNVAVVRWVTEHFFGPRKNRFLCLSLSRTHKQLPSLFLCLFSSSFLSLSLPPSPTHLWRSNNLSHTRIHNIHYISFSVSFFLTLFVCFIQSLSLPFTNNSLSHSFYDLPRQVSAHIISLYFIILNNQHPSCYAKLSRPMRRFNEKLANILTKLIIYFIAAVHLIIHTTSRKQKS